MKFREKLREKGSTKKAKAPPSVVRCFRQGRESKRPLCLIQCCAPVSRAFVH